MTAHPESGWTWEEHQLSEGYSCIAYDEHGQRIADHLDRETAAKIAAAPELYEALQEAARVLFRLIPRIGPEGPNTIAEQEEYETIGGAWSMADRALNKARGQ